MNDILEAKDISKQYDGRKVVKGVSLSIKAGEVVGLLGPNGAGKTTTFYMCVGLVAPDSGEISLKKEIITSDPVYVRARKGLAYLPQEPSVFRKLTVEENILAILETIEEYSPETKTEFLEKLLDDLGLQKIRTSMASSLSGGERRRVEIARALARDPMFILLDEPFAGIDPIAIKDIQGIIEKLKDTGIGVLITDHNVRETLGICDRGYILIDGKVLIEGSPDKIASDKDAQKYYLGHDFSL